MYQRGFTLVEMAIVLVVIALLAVGIAQGVSLINSSRLNAMIKENQSIINAVNIFKAKYNYFPGDFPDASAYYGTNCASPASYCNGNGNGYVEWGSCPNQNEPLLLWQHLSLEGLIGGLYSGVCNNNGYEKSNSYNSVYGNLAIYFIQACGGGSCLMTTPIYANSLILTNGGGVSLLDDWNPVLLPQEAYAIDSKIDDGLPNSGAYYASEGSGTSGTCSSGNSYVAASNTVGCIFIYQWQ